MSKVKNIDILDYGRFLSAFAVMMFHYVVNGPKGGKIDSYEVGSDPFTAAASLGYIGVDFFFMVSGFVIALSAQQATPKQFLRSRFLRLWPTFMLCMTITALVRIGSGRADMDVSVAQYMANWTMAAPFLGYANVDGVYWTLVYELVFYAMMLVMLLLGWVRRLEAICRIWLIAIILLELAGISVPGFTEYFALFCAGCMFSFVWRSGWSRLRVAFLLLVAGYCAIEASTRLKNTLVDDRFALMAITLIFFALFGLFSSTKLGAIKLPFAKTVGLMTYPLYLLHAYIGYVLLSILANEQNKQIAIALVCSLMLAVSYIVVRWFERPMKPLYDKVWPREP